jgi:hypothetical protein
MLRIPHPLPDRPPSLRPAVPLFTGLSNDHAHSHLPFHCSSPIHDHTYSTLPYCYPTDEATALSAVRNLKDVPVNGRNLRVESSTDEPGPRRGRGGEPLPGGPPGAGIGGPPGPPRAAGGYRRDVSPPRGDFGAPGNGYGRPDEGMPRDAGRVDLSALPPGQVLPVGQKATDAISKTLAAVSPGQMQDVMAAMKVSSLCNGLGGHERVGANLASLSSLPTRQKQGIYWPRVHSLHTLCSRPCC